MLAGAGDAAPPGPARALATSALLAGASPVACGQCELQGVGRQVWLCLTGVGSRRNLAQRGPGWPGERDLPACRSPQPPPAARAPRRRTAGPRPRLSPHRYVSPRAKLLLFATVPGCWHARVGRSACWGGRGGSAAGYGSCSRRTPWDRACNRYRETDAGATARADACARQRWAHPQTASGLCGGPADLTVTGWCLPRSAGASRSSPRLGVSLCGRHRV